ncbi:hypothetical protein [Arsenicicoccus dermatophilus]|uniref:hypothetical protein n=1 Tax=Arsenicicoccus dermatophilus TaxID=1076331 RepID=UPI001F4C9FBC|nr:hypothetical protein [Arsenicicoccus dermatophilus]MCH8614477.1 hypothetical protein [Arsenicicoccus dermatophilus]
MADVLPAWALEVLTRPVVRAGLLDLDVTRAAGIDRERDHERAVHAYADSIGAPRGCRPRELCESGDHWARPDAWEHEADLLVLDPGTTAKAAAVRLRRSPGAVCSRRRRLLGRYGRRETGRG